ncbi:MAG: iron-sulfur cluster assembly scaffold protein [Halodesulfurarchaeum sp.]|nr:iron-sulfur cluster assembly scaffold protein [Halodesulfurarchaeum sp.]
MSMGSDMYRQQILDHYKNPRNYGELAEPTFSHRGHNPSCGDDLEFDVELADDGETIESVAFRGEGCAISQAGASLLGQQLPGMTLEEVQELEREDMVDLLGGEISPMRIKCAVLAEKVVQDGAAIYTGDLEDQTTQLEG